MHTMRETLNKIEFLQPVHYHWLMEMQIRLLHTSRLVMLGVLVWFANTGVSPAQSNHTSWKEYSFPEDGFAISLPDAPRKHPDKNTPDATAYSVNINPDYAFTLRVKRDPRECSAVLGQLRGGVLTRKAQETDPASLKDVALDGHPGLEYEWKVSDEKVGRLRYYCGEGRVYILAVNREKNQPLLPEATRIMNSFRLMPRVAK
ncbi:MAG: hypothetical protein JWO20_997 [Candidatus Angelobacter sp.]|nr:hypothetical protein [Candidatus Angelobacter sp.]